MTPVASNGPTRANTFYRVLSLLAFVAVVVLGYLATDTQTRLQRIENPGPCTVNPHSRECHDVLNPAVKGLTPYTACRLVRKANPAFECVTDEPAHRNRPDAHQRSEPGSGNPSSASPAVPAQRPDSGSSSSSSPAAPDFDTGQGGSSPDQPGSQGGDSPGSTGTTPPPSPSPSGGGGTTLNVCVQNPLLPVCVDSGVGLNDPLGQLVPSGD